MERRYQVFVSSTYADLMEERSKVIQTLMEMDCIPAGMELFPAADEEQWKFIESVINDCDYYILIMGGRYGSITDDGISYTEKEYDYAISRGIKVLVFLHGSPEEIPTGKSESDSSFREKLQSFRDKVSRNRLVKTWNSANELPGLVSLSLSKTMKLYPAVGWVRSDSASNVELLAELNELRKENDNLKTMLNNFESQSTLKIPNLATLDESFSVRLSWTERRNGIQHKRSSRVIFTWQELFSCIAPELEIHPNDKLANHRLGSALHRKKYPDYKGIVEVHHDDFQTIRIQFAALGLIHTTYSKTTRGDMALFWTLTPKGQQVMLNVRTIKAKNDEEESVVGETQLD